MNIILLISIILLILIVLCAIIVIVYKKITNKPKINKSLQEFSVEEENEKNKIIETDFNKHEFYDDDTLKITDFYEIKYIIENKNNTKQNIPFKYSIVILDNIPGVNVSNPNEKYNIRKPNKAEYQDISIFTDLTDNTTKYTMNSINSIYNIITNEYTPSTKYTKFYLQTGKNNILMFDLAYKRVLTGIYINISKLSIGDKIYKNKHIYLNDLVFALNDLYHYPDKKIDDISIGNDKKLNEIFVISDDTIENNINSDYDSCKNKIYDPIEIKELIDMNYTLFTPLDLKIVINKGTILYINYNNDVLRVNTMKTESFNKDEINIIFYNNTANYNDNKYTSLFNIILKPFIPERSYTQIKIFFKDYYHYTNYLYNDNILKGIYINIPRININNKQYEERRLYLKDLCEQINNIIMDASLNDPYTNKKVILQENKTEKL